MYRFSSHFAVSFCLSVFVLCLPAAAQAGPEPLFPGWNKLEAGNHSVEFHGYFRTSGGGAFKDGETMPVFIAPGAQSRYRLGNESDTNLEVNLDYRYHLDGKDAPNGRWVQLLGMISDYETNPNYDEVKIEFLEKTNPQSFVRFGNFLGDGVNVWLGRRYYDRRDIHMIDHFWLNVAQGAEFGGGIEGVPIGPGRLDIAGFKNEDDDIGDRLGVNANTRNLDSYTLDLRYRGLPTPTGGDLTLWGMYAQRLAAESINYDAQGGFGFGGWHTQPDVMGGRMTTGLALRYGAALQQGLWNSRPLREDWGYDLDKAYSIELNNDWLKEVQDRYAVQWVGVLRRESRGGGETVNWASTGVRPVYFLNDYVSVATELGVDYVDNNVMDVDGFLGKGTLALQLSRGRGYFERPMIKLFVTGAVWSDDFRGHIGNGNPSKATSYANDTSGTSYGIQFETWW